MQPIPIRKLTAYALAIPLKRRIEHAAAERAVSDTIVVEVELADGSTGYGETLPRTYVTGEDVPSVLGHLSGEFCQLLLGIRPATFFEALEAIEALPMASSLDAPWPAARAGVELALLDAYMRSFGRGIGEICGWMGLAGCGPPGSLPKARFSMVLATRDLGKLRRQTWVARLLGFRHFKLKVGMPDDAARLAIVRRVLGRSLQAGGRTLRVDANAAWDLDAALAWMQRCDDGDLVGVEQPMRREDDEELIPLKERTRLRIIHDESLVSMADAVRLAELGVADGFNIRLSKCGGLLPSLRLAAFARDRKIEVQLGCMVGETSILSAAGLRFLECIPGVRFCEGCFGNLLLNEDVVRRPLRFGLGGRPPRLSGTGWGVEVDEELLRQHCTDRPVVAAL